MRASQKLMRAQRWAGATLFLLGLSFGCARKQQASDQGSASALPALPAVPQPRGLFGELTLSHPGASFSALRELGGPLSALLPAGFPVLVATLLGLPPLTSDSFDPALPVFGALLQQAGIEPGWVLAVHAVSGPELIAKLCTGDHAPFRAVSSQVPGLSLLEPNGGSGGPPSTLQRALAVFDNYLLVASNADALLSAGSYVARMLPRQPPGTASLEVHFSKQALSNQLVPALRGLWAGYRTTLSHLDQSARSAHGGRAPDFADPAQVILGADAVVESLLSLVDDAATLELDLDPFPDRIEATLLFEPEAGSNAQTKLTALAAGTARPLLSLPGETQLALGISRTPTERAGAGEAAGDDWVRLLGARISKSEAQQLRAALADWELGRGTECSYGFLGGKDPGAYLVTDVGDAARLKHAGAGLLGLLSLPGVRAPVTEFLGQPRIVDVAGSRSQPFPNVIRKRLELSATAGRKARLPPLSFAWLIDDKQGFAAAGKSADPVLKQVVSSARGQEATLASEARISDGVQRMGAQAALFAYIDARVLGFMAAFDVATSPPAPLLLALGKQQNAGYLRLEISKAAIDLGRRGALGL